MENLVPINEKLWDYTDSGYGRTEAINKLAEKLNVGVPTLYRWMKDGDHFVYENAVSNKTHVFKQVKAV